MRKSQWQAADRRVNKGRKGRRDREVEIGGHCQSLGLMIGANTRTHGHGHTLTYLHTMTWTHVAYTSEVEWGCPTGWSYYWSTAGGNGVVKHEVILTWPCWRATQGASWGRGIHVADSSIDDSFYPIVNWCEIMQLFVKRTFLIHYVPDEQQWWMHNYST